MKNIKNYRPSINSMSSGQVLHCPYGYEKTKLIVINVALYILVPLLIFVGYKAKSSPVPVPPSNLPKFQSYCSPFKI